MYTAITYIGKTSGFLAKIGNKIYDFEWQKSLGIGKRIGEVHPKDADILFKWRDRVGQKMFILE
jgi:hypothetical protein